MTPKKLKLANGLPVLLIPSHSHPVVSLQAWMNFGAADESDDIAGIAHLFEHLLFKGTEKRGVGQIAHEVEALGGDLNAYTSYDHTVMHLTLLSKHLNQGIDILSDAILNSVVSEEELRNEQPVVLEEIKRKNDSPGAVAGETFRSLLFQGHTYARPVIGYDHIVAGLGREKIMEVYHKTYNIENTFLVVCGDFEESHVMQTLNVAFAKMRKGEKCKDRKHIEPLKSLEQKFVSHTHPEMISIMGWLTPPCTSTDTAALDALALIMGQGESSRLHKKLVLEKKLLHSIDASCWSPKDQGCFAISFRGTKESSKKINEALEWIRSCFEEPITESELAKAKRNLLSTASYSRETVDGLASRFGYYESICGDFHYDGDYLRQVEKLELADLKQAMDTYINWNTFAIGGIVPKEASIPKIEAPKSKLSSKATKALKKQSADIVRFDWKGLRIVLKTVDHLPLFTLRWASAGGLECEPEKLSGLGTLWTRTVGTAYTDDQGRLHKRNEINEFFDGLAAGFSAFFGRHSFGYQLEGLSQDFDRLFLTLLHIRSSSVFEKSVVEHEKKLQLHDLKTALSNPSYVVGRQFSEAMFKNHLYSRSTSGNAETLKRIRSQDLAQFHKKVIEAPQVLSIVGNVTKEQIIAILENSGRKLKFKKPPSKAPKPMEWLPKTKAAQTVKSHLPKEQTHILWGFPTCSMSHKDFWALNGLSAVLSGQSGRLFLELRDKMSLCYTVSPSHLEGISGGYFGFYIATSPEKTETAIAALKREVEKVYKEGISESEWDRAREFFVGNHEIEQQRLSYFAMSMALDELYGLGFENSLAFSKNMSKLKVADFVRVAKKYFGPDRQHLSVLSVVGPK